MKCVACSKEVQRGDSWYKVLGGIVHQDCYLRWASSSTIQPKELKGFSGGISFTAAPENIPELAMEQCENWEYGTRQYTKQDLLDLIDELLPQIREKFAYKNKSYGRDEDAFHNFRNTARRVLNDDSFEGMYKTLLVYKDKHDVALANRGMDDPEYEERFIDNIVYSLIAIGMRRARG
jgi:hypothetical protein